MKVQEVLLEFEELIWQNRLSMGGNGALLGLQCFVGLCIYVLYPNELPRRFLLSHVAFLAFCTILVELEDLARGGSLKLALHNESGL